MAMVSDKSWFRQWIGYCAQCDTIIGVQIKEKNNPKPPYAVCPSCFKEGKDVPLEFSGDFGYTVRDSKIWVKFRRFETRKSGNKNRK